MSEIVYTLLSEGPSDRAFLPLLTWLLHEHTIQLPIQSQWAELRFLDSPPRKLPDKIESCLKFYPCNLLFIHRDADREPREVRLEEINEAVAIVRERQAIPITICVVPVRMQETWLLFDEHAIRRASGNPNGRQPLQLPPINTLEGLAQPKDLLNDLLLEASERVGRRRRGFSVPSYRVAELINDFSPLRALPAFQALENDVRTVAAEQGWDSP